MKEIKRILLKLSGGALSGKDGRTFAVSYTHLDVYKRQILGKALYTGALDLKEALLAAQEEEATRITKRIIPCLDVKDGRVVKGVNFLSLCDVSSPVKLAKYYSDNGADELVFYDITASAEGRQLFTDILT